MILSGKKSSISKSSLRDSGSVITSIYLIDCLIKDLI